VSARAVRHGSAAQSGCAAESPGVAATRNVQAAALRCRFAENLIALRGRKGLSQAVLARRGSLHLTEIGLLERALRMPRLDTIVKIAGSLEVEPCELLAGMAWQLGEAFQRPGAYQRQDLTDPPRSP
jgi:ribosome-binding protein aMBF1 (putative translation factor)